MIVFGGFIGGKLGDCSNHVLKYEFKTSTWKVLFANNPNESISYPKKRMSHGTVILKDNLFTFGGADADEKFADLWIFDLHELKWTHL